MVQTYPGSGTWERASCGQSLPLAHCTSKPDNKGRGSPEAPFLPERQATPPLAVCEYIRRINVVFYDCDESLSESPAGVFRPTLDFVPRYLPSCEGNIIFVAGFPLWHWGRRDKLAAKRCLSRNVAVFTPAKQSSHRRQTGEVILAKSYRQATIEES